MSSFTPSLRLVVITMVVGCVVASLTGATAKERAPAEGNLKMAVVNPARIILESKYYKTETDKLNKLNTDTLTQLRAWDQNSLLSVGDQQSLGDLSVEESVPAGLDANKKAQKQKLLDKSKALFEESVALQSKANLTPQDQDRLREFTKLDADTKSRVQAKSNAVKTQIDTQFAQVREKAEKDARDNITKIAKKDGVNLVFSAEVVLYAENDLTDKVLEALNK